MKIVIITCYFGKLPWYFSYFLHSCGYNLTLDFFIITDDQSFNNKYPKNVHFIYKTLESINKIASQRLRFCVNIQYGYKVCDFRPAFGFLFPDIIEGYDFWGYGDIDVIYGNIRNFITDDLMTKYDLISVRPDWIPGCFLLFKNNKKMKRLFMHSKDYKKVFESNEHYCFDETNFQHEAFTEGKKYYEISGGVESMMHVVQRLNEFGYIKTYFDLHIIEGVPGKLKWDKGILTYKRVYEVMLYHLIKLKNIYRPRTIHKTIPNLFFISPTQIYS